jgi:TPR repeat protein
MYTYGGYGLEPNQTKAAKIFLSINNEDCYAHQSGNKEAWTDINYELGKIHENAITTKRDIWKAQKCYEVAAGNGNEEAALAVNQVDRNEANRKATESKGSAKAKLKQETEENKSILAKAEAGDPSAQYSMGYKYLAGIGVSANLTEATAWFNKSAKQGDRDAQAYLGFAYNTGTGVAANNATAIEWFQKATNQGHRMASNQLHAVFGHPKYKNPERPSVEGIGQQAGIALCGNLARVVRDNYRFSIFEEDLTICRVDDRTMTAYFSDDLKLVFDKVHGKMHITGFIFGFVQKICMNLSTDQRCKYIAY